MNDEFYWWEFKAEVNPDEFYWWGFEAEVNPEDWTGFYGTIEDED